MTCPDLLGLLALLALATALVGMICVLALVRALRYPPRRTFAVALGRGDPTDPGEMGLAFEAVTFSLVDQSATPGWVIAGHDPAGPVAVVVHGFGDSRYASLKWAPLLTPHASQVVVYDLRGHGEAESAQAHCGTTDAADLLGILDQIHPPRPVVLLGCSMGAGIAIAAAARHADVEAQAQAPAQAQVQTGAGAGVRLLGVIADGPYRLWDEPIRCYFRARRHPVWPIIPLTGLLLRLTAPGFADFDRAALARRLRCPLLVLHGEDDWLCPVTSARAIAAAAPDGRLVEFPGGGHLDLAAVDERRYREAIDAFFAELTRRERSATDADFVAESGRPQINADEPEKTQ